MDMESEQERGHRLGHGKGPDIVISRFRYQISDTIYVGRSGKFFY
jgi:hypothetical protein